MRVASAAGERGPRPEVGRAFVAVRPPDEVLEAVERSVAPARRSMVGPRWAGPEQWHLTLQFLGPVPALAPVVDGLRLAALSCPAFSFGLGGGGAFPSLRRARVIWIGAAQGGEAMTALAAAVGSALAPLGYQGEARRFSPHLTVARLRDQGDVSPAVEAIGPERVGPAWTVEEIILYESRLSPKGSTYTVLSRLPLGRGA
jgi:2'-5' RNA ligase